MCFDTLYTAANAKYAELIASGRSSGYCCNLVTLEAGSRGHIHVSPDTVKAIKPLVPATKADYKALLHASIKTVITKSFDI